MTTVLLTQPIDKLVSHYNLSKTFGLLSENNIKNGAVTCDKLSCKLDTILNNAKKTDNALTRVLPESLVNALTPARGVGIERPKLANNKLAETWKRWRNEGLFYKDDIPPYWNIENVSNAYSQFATQFVHYDPEISPQKIFMYATAPKKGILVLGSMCPFLLPLLAAFDKLDRSRHTSDPSSSARFNLPYEGVSESVRNGNRFNSLSVLASSDFASSDHKTVFVFSFGHGCARTNGILDLIAQTPYGFEAKNVFPELVAGLSGYAEVTVTPTDKKAHLDLMALTTDKECYGIKLVEDVFSTFSAMKYPFVSAVLGYGRGAHNQRESLFARVFLKCLKFSNPALVKMGGMFVGAEVFVVRDEVCRQAMASPAATVNTVGIYLALRALARYIDGDTCHMRKHAVKFDRTKRSEFVEIMNSLNGTDMAKTWFGVEHHKHSSGEEHYKITTEKNPKIEYIKNYNAGNTKSPPTACDVSGVFKRELLPCSKRFTALIRRPDDGSSGSLLPPAKLYGNITETAGIYHEMMAYMVPSGFFFARLCKFFSLYMIFLYNLVKFSLSFISGGEGITDDGQVVSYENHIKQYYELIVRGVIKTTSDAYATTTANDVEASLSALNSITIGQVLNEARCASTEEHVNTISNHIRNFSQMIHECGAEDDEMSTRALAVSYSKW